MYPVPGYPTVYLTEAHEQTIIRPMVLKKELRLPRPEAEEPNIF
jgi:hypothetical protein